MGAWGSSLSSASLPFISADLCDAEVRAGAVCGRIGGAECRRRDWPGVGRKSWAGACSASHQRILFHPSPILDTRFDLIHSNLILINLTRHWLVGLGWIVGQVSNKQGTNDL